MIVTLDDWTARTVGSRKQIKLPQWRIRVDGRHAGLLSHREGSKPILHGNWSDEDAAEISRQVAELAGRDQVEAVQAPDVPQSMRDEVRGETIEPATDEDFDE